MLIKSSLAIGSLKITESECEDLLEQDISVNNKCLALKYQSKLLKKKYGYSNNYYFILSKLWTTASDTENMPAAIFLLGDYYQNIDDYNKAWSAYSDCVKKYPKSPEAKTALLRIEELNKYQPIRADYTPSVDVLKPYQNNGKNTKQNMVNNTYYSVMVGPFKDLKQANRIKKLLDIDDFKKIFKSNNEFYICIGKSNSINAATDVKIRLAEEFEMMGEIVKIESDDNTFYIYEVD
jgi:tetratricopeptide (TPR) repeat protein